MRVFSGVAIGALTLAVPCLSNAQTTGSATKAQATQPADDMQSLIKALSGHWSLKVKVEPSKEAPKGLDGAGEETWHAGPEGLTLTDEERFNAGPQTLAIVGLLWRDTKTNELHAMDCDNQNPHTCDLKGAVEDVRVHWTGSELTIDEKETSPQGKVMTSRIVWSDINANSFRETGYLGSPGGPFQKQMTILATRTATK
jgi:hypothetical protein